MARISINHPDNWLELREEEEVSGENRRRRVPEKHLHTYD